MESDKGVCILENSDVGYCLFITFGFVIEYHCTICIDFNLMSIIDENPVKL